MFRNLQPPDHIVFIGYFLLVACYGYYIYNKKKSRQASSTDFFLAEGSLTWWAIGASIIASNISAEQFVGMSGNGFRLGLAISVYEWSGAVGLILVAVFFIPIFLKNEIYTMPQFLQKRYNEPVGLIMAVFWLFLYVFVNLTSILFLGTIALSNLVGDGYFHIVMICLAAAAFIITIGGMKVIGYTDVIQVFFLILGGLATTYLALTLVSEKFGMGSNVFAGFNQLLKQAPEHFKMIFDKPSATSSPEEINRYISLPGLAMMAAGMWVANLNYWGCNQYITQRALGADLKTARNGILFSAFLKLLMPLIVVLPGIAAYVLYQHGELQQQMLTGGEFREDNAYAAILNFLPVGLKGLSLAALTAAIVASLAGKANSISTIFTLDIYKKYLNKNSDEKKLIWIGRLTIILAIVIAIAVNWNDAIGIGSRGGFEFIQKYTGFVSPGILAVFLLGFFWKRTTSAAAFTGIIGSLVLSVIFDRFIVNWLGTETLWYTAYPDANGTCIIPFMVSMGWVFVFTVVLMIAISLLFPGGPKEGAKIEVDGNMFRLSSSTWVLIAIILSILTALYIRFW
ncbi:sodium/solute symporter (plasmid) [Pedobacter sp. BS3]|uniref:sodium:solute symporter family transporter n=1 Tax=Pedobacter sp. BS3 TaxID=2567937 RepID=UPI0011ED3CDD|nr:sodium/solute symporter [Pedobacter sp. BS3]TZF85837.1 sodium/solute symporter [Pedobacter sp. BS3]